MYRLTLSDMPVFDILKPGQEEGTYNNLLMDCSSMGEYLDVLSAHDWLKDADCKSLDLGFPLSDDDQMTTINNQPESDILDMEFPTSSDDDRSNDETLDLGFPPEPDIAGEPLDLGFDVNPPPQPAGTTDDGALEMGFDSPDMGNDVQLKENPLEMGYEVDPAHDVPDQSFAVSRPDPIGFVIQRAVGDLRVAMHRLDMDRAGDTMSPDEAFVIQQVLDCAQELLLACQLISISQLLT
ncbi:uncharacterized protein F5147DRAFT_651487 [Suillus discolor]|uniref:Uncharacterized protein n=1 Tax=Suillus discolor TaxID=1912936 RepID=A0A9P7FB98_9AGAM|nr:uncharacterized protein F5147DRAFT_651487 [Suillus discolor]KAG2111301.1 hypothetical protein F5147DRAFT_651487 [Suillus discolor]